MSLGDYLAVLRKRWLSVAVVTLGMLGIASAYTLTSSTVYAATTQNFVALAGEGGSTSPLSGAQFAAQRVKSYTEIVSSPDVLEPVVQELQLPYSAQQLAGKVTAANPPLTVLILVTAFDANPIQAAEIANAVSVQLGRTIEALETPNAASVSPVKVTLTDPAVPPSTPSAPRTRLNLVVGLIVGVAAGVGWAFLRNALDRTVKSVAELGKLTEMPTLGAVLFDSNAKSQVLSALDTKAVQGEGYRTVRTNMQFVSVDDPVRAFVVTSAAPGDGKTIVACNLAIAMAQTGQKVCLVESDLRRPRVTEYLELPSGQGLTEVLAGRIRLEEALQSWGGGILTVLPPGSLPPNPSELLGSHQMRNVVDKLRQSFDLVILDTPPLLAVSDAAVLAAQTDGAVVVVRYAKSSHDSVRNALDSLGQVNANILGTVLNAVPVKRGGAYGYGYGYDDETKGKATPTPMASEPPTAPSSTGKSGS